MGRAQRFRGVRQRHWGSWVSEIRHPVTKIRVWLGTFQTAEDAAHAYDEAARLLCGPHAKTNFPYTPCTASSGSILSPALREKLLRCCIESMRKLQDCETSSSLFLNRSSGATKSFDFQKSKYAKFASWQDIPLEKEVIKDGNGRLLHESPNDALQKLDEDIVAEMIEELLQSSSLDLDFNLPDLPSPDRSASYDSMLFDYIQVCHECGNL